MPALSDQSNRAQEQSNQLVVYYDGACPKCMRDRERYEKLSGVSAVEVSWCDISGKDNYLRGLGIDPRKALTELHVRDSDGRVVSELDAYILLMKRVPLLKPVAWLIGLPVIRPALAQLYHWQVARRLRRAGRL